MLDKLGGTFAPRPRCGPHKLTECLPLCLIVRRKLLFAQNTKEVIYIIRNRAIKVDGKVRTDKKYPAGFMDVVSFPNIHEHYRVLYNVNKKFYLQSITEEEAKFKLCKVTDKKMENKGILTLHTNDGRTIRYANPDIMKGDTIKLNLETQEMEKEYYPFTLGKTGFVFRGKNMGCVGILRETKKHVGGFLMATLEDLNGRIFITKADNVMVIGENGQSMITLPKEKGIRLSEIVKSNAVYGDIVEEEALSSEEDNSIEEE